MNKILNKYLKISKAYQEFHDYSFVKILKQKHPLCHHTLILNKDYKVTCMYNCCPGITINTDNKVYYLKNKSYKLKNKVINLDFEEIAQVLKTYFILFYKFDEVTLNVIYIIKIMQKLYNKYNFLTKKLILNELSNKVNCDTKVIERAYSLLMRNINLDYLNNKIKINISTLLKNINTKLVYLLKNFKNIEYCTICSNMCIPNKKNDIIKSANYCYCVKNEKKLMNKLEIYNFDKYLLFYQKIKLLHENICLLLKKYDNNKYNNTLNINFVEDLIVNFENTKKENLNLYENIYDLLIQSKDYIVLKKVIKQVLKHILNNEYFTLKEEFINCNDIDLIYKFQKICNIYGKCDVSQFFKNICYKNIIHKRKKQKLCL